MDKIISIFNRKKLKNETDLMSFAGLLNDSEADKITKEIYSERKSSFRKLNC